MEGRLSKQTNFRQASKNPNYNTNTTPPLIPIVTTIITAIFSQKSGNFKTQVLKLGF